MHTRLVVPTIVYPLHCIKYYRQKKKKKKKKKKKNWSFPFTLKCATNTCVLSTVLMVENFLDLAILDENRDTFPVISMSIVGWSCNARLLATIPKVVSVDSVATTCVNSYKNWCSLIEGGMTGAIIAAAWKIRVAETTRGTIKFINGTIAILHLPDFGSGQEPAKQSVRLLG